MQQVTCQCFCGTGCQLQDVASASDLGQSIHRDCTSLRAPCWAKQVAEWAVGASLGQALQHSGQFVAIVLHSGSELYYWLWPTCRLRQMHADSCLNAQGGLFM